MKNIAEPIERALLKQELNAKTFLRPTCKAGNEIYDFTAHDAPNVMLEIGRLREISFRSGGGGTGKELDIDDCDTRENPYRQLIVWDPDHEEIVGGYRYMEGKNTRIDSHGEPDWVMSHMFHFSDKFREEYLPQTIELGRAFVQPKYQTAEMGKKSLYALDNIWDGLGAVIYNKRNEIKYLIGKVTLYPSFHEIARGLLYEFLSLHFPDKYGLITAMEPLPEVEAAKPIAKEIFKGECQADDYKALQKEVRKYNEVVPAMFSAYIGLSATMMTFGTGTNDTLGDVYETGIMQTIADFYDAKRMRYIDSYAKYLETLNQ